MTPLPPDIVNEPGVNDATYQDFVAPAVLGVGLAGQSVPAIQSALSAVPTMAGRFLTANAVKQAITSSTPAVSKWISSGPAVPQGNTMEEQIQNWIGEAERIGDWGTAQQYKWVLTAINSNQIDDLDAASILWKIRAGESPVAQALAAK